MTNIENRDNFTLQDLHEAELDELYDALMQALMDSWTHKEFIDEDDVNSVLRDVFDDWLVTVS